MAQIRQTRYVCDSCGNDVEKRRDLRKFHVYTTGGGTESLAFDVCVDCETKLLVALTPFAPDAHDLARTP